MEGKLFMLKKIFKPKLVFIERQLTELDNLALVAMVTNLPWKQRKVQLQFRSLVYVPNLVFTAVIFFCIFIMLWRCRHYTPELIFKQ